MTSVHGECDRGCRLGTELMTRLDHDWPRRLRGLGMGAFGGASITIMQEKMDQAEKRTR